MEFPLVVLTEEGGLSVFHSPAPFASPDGVQHPAAAWSCWTAEDWAEKVPGWRILPLVDVPPEAPVGKRLERQPVDQWAESAGTMQVTYSLVDLTSEEVSALVEQVRRAKLAAINAERARRLALGAPYAGKLIDVSDKGRADLGGMSVAALLAQSGAVSWSPGYSTGWITQDNSRVPLPVPTDGLALASAVGDWYGRTMQHARDLKDAALAAADPSGIDHLVGWPD